jgi:hypothetical protein
MNWPLMVATTGLLLTIAPAQKKVIAATALPSNQRFQLFSAQVEYRQDNGTDLPEHEVFLLDSQTGRVWRYQSNATMETQPGKNQDIPEHFLSVDIDQ